MQLSYPAALTGLKMAISGVLGMAAILIFHLNFGYWVVVTVAAITAHDNSATLSKSGMRLIGTVGGATLGYLIVLTAGVHVALSLVLFFIAIVVFMLVGLQRHSISYAGTIAGVTTVVIIGASIDSGALMSVAVYRTCEVILGVIITAAISFLLHPQKINLPTRSASLPFKFCLQRHIIYGALRIAITVFATYVFWLWLRFPEGFWITISCLFVMEENLHNTYRRSWLRFLAHVLAAAFGLVAALICGQNAWLLGSVLFVGFFCCGYIIGQKTAYSGLGNTAGIAMAIMLLAGFNQGAIFEIVSLRFINVCIGIAISMLMTHHVLPVSATKTKAA